MNQKKKEKFIQKYIPIITLILFYIILGILNPKFMSIFNMKTILIICLTGTWFLALAVPYLWGIL